MKAQNIFLLFIMLFLFSNTSCQSRNEILKIEKIVIYSVSGGKGGASSEVIIAKDSISYVNNDSDFYQYNKTTKIKTPEALWNKMMESLNIEKFDLVKSNPGHVQYDGSDVTVSVYSKGKIHSITNAEDDKINFENIKHFYHIIEDIRFRLSDVYGLNGKLFSATIGSVCQETSVPDPCAGYQILLELNFKQFEVEVIEKEVSSCGKVQYENKYTSDWYFQNSNEVLIKKLVSRDQQIIEKNTLIFNSEKEIIGIAINKLQEKYVFNEKD